MKQAGYTKRPYTRSPERPRQSHTKQSNGPSNDGKMRGNPQQCVEKYLNLARDATSLGDPISAENYYQYADHYYRLLAANRITRVPHSEQRAEKSESESASESQPQPDLQPKQDGHWLD